MERSGAEGSGTAAPGMAMRSPRARGGLETLERRLGLALVLPALLLVAGVYLYPAVLTLIFSFAQVDLVELRVDRLVGLRNYAYGLSEPLYRAAFWRTIYFSTVVVVAGMGLSLALALLLTQRFWGRGLLRVAVLLPWAVPPVVAGVMWGTLFHAEIGLVNVLLHRWGFIGDPVVWLGHPTLALHVIISAEVWRALPFMTLFLLAGLQTIPGEVYEAAAIDGAQRWHRLRYVTLPLIAPVAIPVAMVQFIYKESFEFLDLGYGSALAYLLLLLGLALVAAFLLPGRQVPRYAGRR